MIYSIQVSFNRLLSLALGNGSILRYVGWWSKGLDAWGTVTWKEWLGARAHQPCPAQTWESRRDEIKGARVYVSPRYCAALHLLPSPWWRVCQGRPWPGSSETHLLVQNLSFLQGAFGQVTAPPSALSSLAESTRTGNAYEDAPIAEKSWGRVGILYVKNKL